MDFASPRRILIALALVAAVYAAALFAWFPARGPYARTVCAAARTVGFPVTGLQGSVRADLDRWVYLTYVLPYPRTGGWGRVRQRFLDFADLPLAAALAAGAVWLGWRRRVATAAAAIGLLFLCHTCLILWSARGLSRILADPALHPADLDGILVAASRQATGFGNISAAVTVILTLAAALALTPRTRAPATEDS